MTSKSLGEFLDAMTAPGKLYQTLPDGSVRCYACGHRCLVRPGRRGICQVRFNADGELRVPWGYVAGLNVDPIEKKPFYHVLPGADALTFGMLGCDFHCAFCQNSFSSQAMRDPASDAASALVRRIKPEHVVSYALHSGAEIIASSYNEPLITTEWAVDIFRLAVQADLKCVYVSNGNATPEVLDYLKPYLTAYKIDLKTMQDKQYRRLGGVLNNVLDSIRLAYSLGLWVEIVTLVVPGFNDGIDELMDAARFIVSVSPDIPWHVTAFHPDYRMTDQPPTSARTLLRAAEIGEEAGLHYVYAGNLPGRVKNYEDTTCPSCRQPVIERVSFSVRSYRLKAQGICPNCGEKLPGVWTDHPEAVNVGGWGLPRRIVR